VGDISITGSSPRTVVAAWMSVACV